MYYKNREKKKIIWNKLVTCNDYIAFVIESTGEYLISVTL